MTDSNCFNTLSLYVEIHKRQYEKGRRHTLRTLCSSARLAAFSESLQQEKAKDKTT